MTATASPTDDFFKVGYDDTEIPEAVSRDRWGRPLIVPPEGGDPVPYTRMSSLAGYVENKSGLHIWDVRQVVVGLGIREDLAAMAACLPSLTGDRKKDAATNARLSEIAEEARIAAGAHAGANWGTAVHGFTEMGQEGNPAVPERMKADVRSYWDMLKELHLICVATEVFVVNDRLKTAGTFDDLYWSWKYGLIVGDKKTGKKNMHSALIQLSGYSDAEIYDPETGGRRPLVSLLPAELLAQADRLGVPEGSLLNRERVLYIHIPNGEGRTEVFELDATLGLEAAEHAAWIRDFQRRKDFVLNAEPLLLEGVEEQRQQVRDTIPLINSVDEMKALWQRYADVWTDELSVLGQNHLRANVLPSTV